MDFKIIELPNVHFDHEKLLDYYNTISKSYNYLKWTADLIKNKPTQHSVDEMYAWAIQSNSLDPNIPCPPYHFSDPYPMRDPEEKFSTPTDLIFGIAKNIIDSFPDVRQTVIAAHPPGTRIGTHVDNDEFIKIHIPIKSNDKSYFIYEDETFVMKEGFAYLVNTTLPHGTDNQGDTDRIHLIFKLPTACVNDIIEKTYDI